MRKAFRIKQATVGVALCALIVGGCALAGCSSASATNQSIDDRVAAAQASHPGRYENSGSHGCYGCHGASSEAWPILATAPKMPAFHFETDNPTSFDDVGESYQDCATCHIAITGEQ